MLFREETKSYLRNNDSLQKHQTMKLFTAVLSVCTLPLISALNDGEGRRNLQVGVLPPMLTYSGSGSTSPNKQECFTVTMAGDGGESSSRAAVDIVFALDKSGSMGFANNIRLSNAKLGIDAFIDDLDFDRDYVGFVAWDTAVRSSVNLGTGTTGFQAVKDQLAAVVAGGGTNLNSGIAGSNSLLEAAEMTLEASGRVADKAIVFISDGLGDYSSCPTNRDDCSDNTKSAFSFPVCKARREGYKIYSLNIISGDVSRLTDMAVCTGGEYIFAANVDQIEPKLKDEILNTIQSSSVPYNVILNLNLGDNLVLDPAMVSATLGTLSVTGENIEWTGFDGGDGFPDGETATLSFCGEYSATGLQDVIEDGLIKFVNKDGVAQSDVPVDDQQIIVKPNGVGGDPHFLLFKHERRSTFHGECDLVLFHNGNVVDNKDVDIHVRTTVQDFFSYVDSVAIKVGDDILEFLHDSVTLNQEPVAIAPDSLFKFGNGYSLSIRKTQKKSFFWVELGEKITINVNSGRYMSASISGSDDALLGSLGIMGDFETGSQYARDGQTVVESFHDFGMEWQVNPLVDPTLFADNRSPQLPYERCRFPSMAQVERRQRRLRGVAENTKLVEDATKACEQNHPDNADSCLQDVLLTGDLDMAMVW
mmetsp:Transcript_17729/g.35633  ORF Transcript_17729/g.35633 Transcript_17729/m.35633 type:complete len:647 (-) Transcript_17729:235-2175(-)